MSKKCRTPDFFGQRFSDAEFYFSVDNLRMGIWIVLAMLAGVGAQESATLSAPDPKYGQIQGLQLGAGSVAVKVYQKDGKPLPVATISGSLSSAAGASMTAQGRPVKLQPNGSFSLLMVLTGEATWLPLVVTRQGRAQKAFAMVRYPEFARVQGGMPAQTQAGQQQYQIRNDDSANVSFVRKKWFLTPSVHYLSVNHSETVTVTDPASTSSVARTLGMLAAKLRFGIDFTPKVFGILDVGYTPLTLASNATGATTAILDGSALVGFQVGNTNFRAGLGLGYGFDTMIVSDLSFGYQNLSGIQLAPHLAYSFNRNVELLVRYRYQMILSLALFTNYAMKIEGELNYFLKNNHPLTVRGAYELTSFSTGSTTSSTSISQSRFYAGLGYGF
jgi:hypothetical protein